MASITEAQLLNDMALAIADFPVTLTVSIPTAQNGATYTATKQDLIETFIVDENGREEQLDTRFYISAKSYVTLPAKGWIISDGTNTFRIVSKKLDSSGHELRLDCIHQYQASSR